MKTTKLLLLTISVCFLVRTAFGCLNVSGTTLDGGATHRGLLNSAKFLQRSLDSNVTKRGEEMEERLRGGSDFTNRNDYAVALIFVGRTEEAIRLLEEVEKEWPDNYATAANLGTAYELAGKNQLALKWIEEGIRRNPESHEGTEWVHVKILEAKIRQEQDPGYFQTHSVLGLDPRRIQKDGGLITVAGKSLTAKRVAGAIYYQLMERMQFVKKSDPAVASLLFDYGVIEAATGAVENARGLLEMAVKFGYPQNKVLPLYTQFDSAIQKRTIRNRLFWSSIGLAVVTFVVFAVKRGWITMTRGESAFL